MRTQLHDDKTAQTIQFFLPQGEPRGFALPRSPRGSSRPCSCHAANCLRRRSETSSRASGVHSVRRAGGRRQAGRLHRRDRGLLRPVLQHNRTLDFWQTAVAIVSKTNSFTRPTRSIWSGTASRWPRRSAGSICPMATPRQAVRPRADAGRCDGRLRHAERADFGAGLPAVRGPADRDGADVFELSGRTARGAANSSRTASPSSPAPRPANRWSPRPGSGLPPRGRSCWPAA
jgi:hypothetical protein